MDNKALYILILQMETYRKALSNMKDILTCVLETQIKNYDAEIESVKSKIKQEYQTCEHSGITFPVNKVADAPVDTGE